MEWKQRLPIFLAKPENSLPKSASSSSCAKYSDRRKAKHVQIKTQAEKQAERDKAAAKEEHIKALQDVAKEECRSLCEAMYLQLPREIRDIIYCHLAADSTIYVGPEYLLKTSEPCMDDRGAHYWNTAYVGEEIKRELVESWYRNTLFYFYDTPNNPTVVEGFLATDRWGYGINPRDFICRVQFNFGVVMDRLHSRHRCCRIRGLAENISAPLKDMRKLPNHIRFIIRIHTYRAIEHYCLDDEELLRTLEVLMQDLKSLKSEGHQLTVKWTELPKLELGTKMNELDAVAWKAKIDQVCDARACLNSAKPTLNSRLWQKSGAKTEPVHHSLRFGNEDKAGSKFLCALGTCILSWSHAEDESWLCIYLRFLGTKMRRNPDKKSKIHKQAAMSFLRRITLYIISIHICSMLVSTVHASLFRNPGHRIIPLNPSRFTNVRQTLAREEIIR